MLTDHIFMMYEDSPDMTWSESYSRMLDQVRPGLNVMIVHPAYDNEEMQAVAVNHPDFGSAWRQCDLEFVTSREFKDMLKEHNIQLVSWKEITAVWY